MKLPQLPLIPVERIPPLRWLVQTDKTVGLPFCVHQDADVIFFISEKNREPATLKKTVQRMDRVISLTNLWRVSVSFFKRL